MFLYYLYILFRYNPRYYFAIEASYGTTSDLKEMIDEMHKNGIRVILDGVRSLYRRCFLSIISIQVYNHSDCSSPLTQIDHDYWYHHNPKDITSMKMTLFRICWVYHFISFSVLGT